MQQDPSTDSDDTSTSSASSEPTSNDSSPTDSAPVSPSPSPDAGSQEVVPDPSEVGQPMDVDLSNEVIKGSEEGDKQT